MASDLGGLPAFEDQEDRPLRADAAASPTGPGALLESVRPPAFARGVSVSIAAAGAVFALAIMASGGQAEVTGIPMTQTTGALFWGLAILAVVLTGIGAQYVELTAARAAESLGQPRRSTSLPTAWAIPAAAVGAALLLVATYHNRPMLVAGPAIAFLGVAGGLVARDLLEDTIEGTERTAALIHSVLVHVVAFLALSAIYMNKLSPWWGAPLVAIFTVVLIVEALERGRIPDAQRVLYAMISAGVMMMALLIVNWWPTYGWTGGAALLLCFFVLAGLLTTRAQGGTIRDRDVIEFGLVFLIGLIVIAVTL